MTAERLEEDLRRLAMVLGGLAFLWACAATWYLLLASSQAGIATSATLPSSGAEPSGMPPSLATAEGVWMAGLLIGVTLLAGMPLGVGLAHPAAQRATAWTTGLLLLGFCFVSGFPMGLLYLPSTILLVVAGAVGRVERQSTALADFRA